MELLNATSKESFDASVSIIGMFFGTVPKLIPVFGLFWMYADRELDQFFKTVKNREQKEGLEQVFNTQNDYMLVVKKNESKK